MADGEVTGLTALIERFNGLPLRMKQRVLRGWATAQGNRMASMMRPGVQAVAFKTGRLVGSIQRAIGARAYRGRVTPRRMIAGMAPHIHAMIGPIAQEDLAKRIERALARNGE